MSLLVFVEAMRFHRLLGKDSLSCIAQNRVPEGDVFSYVCLLVCSQWVPRVTIAYDTIGQSQAIWGRC